MSTVIDLPTSYSRAAVAEVFSVLDLSPHTTIGVTITRTTITIESVIPDDDGQLQLDPTGARVLVQQATVPVVPESPRHWPG